jgi:hypothetical protein
MPPESVLAPGAFAFVNLRKLDANAVLAETSIHQAQLIEAIAMYSGARAATVEETIEGGRAEPRFEAGCKAPATERSSTTGPTSRRTSSARRNTGSSATVRTMARASRGSRHSRRGRSAAGCDLPGCRKLHHRSRRPTAQGSRARRRRSRRSSRKRLPRNRDHSKVILSGLRSGVLFPPLAGAENDKPSNHLEGRRPDLVAGAGGSHSPRLRSRFRSACKEVTREPSRGQGTVEGRLSDS